MIARDKLLEMLNMQHAMNSKVNPDWFNAGYPWLRAIIVEGGEAMDHHGWKWWKKQDINREQLAIELVDIWHFALSNAIVRAGSIDDAATQTLQSLNSTYQANGCMFDGREYLYANIPMLNRIELMIGLAAAGRFQMTLFATLLKDLDMSWDELYVGYIAKNVLNFFRQDNGYKAGTYIKQWGDNEDNEVLSEIVKLLDFTDPEFSEHVMQALKQQYALVLQNHGRMSEAEKLLGPEVNE